MVIDACLVDCRVMRLRVGEVNAFPCLGFQNWTPGTTLSERRRRAIRS